MSIFKSVTMGHKARETVALLSQETPDFIPLSLWSLNPVDYKVWGLLQEQVYRSPVKDIDDLGNRVMQEWDRLDQQVIDQACKRKARDFYSSQYETRPRPKPYQISPRPRQDRDF